MATARPPAKEGDCATQLASARAAIARLPEAERDAAEAEQLAAQLKKSAEEQRRLEERVSLLSRDLELTETEVIRTKAKLKGLETKAEASSAIAEAKILMRRLADLKGHTANMTRCQELVDRAEQQLEDENYGAASFFALKAQELLGEARRSTTAEALEHPAAKRQYVVAAETANIRQEPSMSAPVVGKANKGTLLDASAVRGEWVKVKLGELSGWVHRSLLE